MIMAEEKNLKKMLDDMEKDVDFQTLKEKYEQPNCVSIMGRTRREEWHSNFVKWLLDPNENHKLGKAPLEKFLELIDKKNEKLKLNEVNIERMGFQTEFPIDIDGKKGRIDVVGFNDNFVLVVENKIKSPQTKTSDGECQSDIYYKYFESTEEFKQKRKCYVHLTADPKNKLENKNFVLVTYQELLDNVIKPVYARGKVETQKVLEQYIIDISNPFLYESVMAYAEIERADRIYQRHGEIIKLIRQIMNDVDRDEETDVCKFYNSYKNIINRLVLEPLGKYKILPETGEKLTGKELMLKLCEDGYVKPNITCLIYWRHGGWYIIKIDENYMCHAGFCSGAIYNGSEDIEFLVCKEDIHKAAAEIEKINHPPKDDDNFNGGKSTYDMKFYNAGNGANGKTIRELYPKWFDKK